MVSILLIIYILWALQFSFNLTYVTFSLPYPQNLIICQVVLDLFFAEPLSYLYMKHITLMFRHPSILLTLCLLWEDLKSEGSISIHLFLSKSERSAPGRSPNLPSVTHVCASKSYLSGIGTIWHHVILKDCFIYPATQDLPLDLDDPIGPSLHQWLLSLFGWTGSSKSASAVVLFTVWLLKLTPFLLFLVVYSPS